ncbi:MAG: hypothetical protein ACLUQY_01315 [Weissella confusa]
MITGAKDYLVDGGTLTVVCKEAGAPSAKALMAETFGNAATIARTRVTIF